MPSVVPIQTAVDVLTDRPELAAALIVVLRLARAWQSDLSWYEYRTLHGFKRILFPALESTAPVSLVNDKGGREDAEYLTTRKATVTDTVRTLRQGGGSLHLVCSVKRRPATHGDPLTRAHVVWHHPDGNQTEAFVFANDDGSTDVYVHYEPAPTDPVDHLQGDEQVDGDPRGVVRAALGLDAE
jgi:cold shock CspA family protein